eukprot:SM000179S03400  [mRNA]  locus=s179:96453:97459:+ [translate_table: standard]
MAALSQALAAAGLASPHCAPARPRLAGQVSPSRAAQGKPRGGACRQAPERAAMAACWARAGLTTYDAGRRGAALLQRRSSARVCRSQQGAGGCCGGGGGADGGCRGGDGASSEASRLEALLGSSAAPSQQGFSLGQMDGSITREVLQDVIGVMPEAMARPQAEKFLDIDGLLAEVRALGDDDFVF